MLAREQINTDIKASKQETNLWQNLHIFFGTSVSDLPARSTNYIMF